MAGWTIVTATYFAFRDDVLTRLIARQAEMQFAYEDRIAEMRAQVDRVTSRQLLDQEQFEQKLEQLMRRQATLESRADDARHIRRSGTPPGRSGRPARGAAADRAAAKPAPISDARDRRRRTAARGLNRAASPRSSRASPDERQGGASTGTLGATAGLARPRRSAADRRRSTRIEDNFEGRRGACAACWPISASTARRSRREPASAVHSCRCACRADAGAFERQLQRINVARAHVERLTRTLVTVPVRKPVHGELDLSSGFGVRIDPFLGRPAMHTGLDFRGDTGDPVRATAAGTVIACRLERRLRQAWSRSITATVCRPATAICPRSTSRSARPSRSARSIGGIGSTGRSTGPHLHYETRIDGDAVDPQKFLRAGAKLGVL